MSGTLDKTSGYGVSTISQDQQTQTLSEISKLQDMEKNLYTKLQKISSNGSGVSDQQDIIDEINKLSSMRISLFSGLTDDYSELQDSVAQSRNDLVDQLTTVSMVEAELDSAKKNLDELQTVKNNHQRMAEINTYYGRRYQAHTYTMKLLIYISVPVLILAILRQRGILSNGIVGGLITVILIIGGFLISRHLMDINSRDNMVYDEYNWGDSWSPEEQNGPSVWEFDKDQLEKAGDKIESEFDQYSSAFGCIGSDCCDEGTSFSNDTNKCEPNKTKNTESFVNNTGKLASSVAFVSSPSPVCPWGKSNSVVSPYLDGATNYATV